MINDPTAVLFILAAVVVVAVVLEARYHLFKSLGSALLAIFGLGRLVGLDLKTLAVASQANIGGPASAMALATARGYASRLLPGMAAGLLGYAVGNYSGLAIAALMRGVLGG